MKPVSSFSSDQVFLSFRAPRNSYFVGVTSRSESSQRRDACHSCQRRNNLKVDSLCRHANEQRNIGIVVLLRQLREDCYTEIETNMRKSSSFRHSFGWRVAHNWSWDCLLNRMHVFDAFVIFFIRFSPLVVQNSRRNLYYVA